MGCSRFKKWYSIKTHCQQQMFSMSPIGTMSLCKKSLHWQVSPRHFVENICKAPIHSNQIVSLDKVSMFTMVSTDKIPTMVQDKLAADPLLKEHTCIPIDKLMEMFTFCVEITYFGIGSDIYQLQEGLAMGLPL